MHKIWIYCLAFLFGQYVHAGQDFGFKFTERPSWNTVKPGEEIRLTCATNLRADRIIWHLNHKAVIPDEYVKIKPRNRRHTSLVLKVPTEERLWKEYVGIYQCIASVGSVSVVSLPGRIEVAYMKPFPEASEVPQVVNSPEGGWSIITCQKPDSVPEAMLTFYKDGKKISLENNTEYLQTSRGDLIIRQSSLSTMGTYSCEAYNTLLKKTVQNPTSTKLMLTSKIIDPEVFNMVFEDRNTVKQGSSVRLICLPYGQGNPPIKWLKKTSSGSQVLDSQAPAISESITETTDFECITTFQENTISSAVTIKVQRSPSLIRSISSSPVSEGSTMSLSCEFNGTPTPSVIWVFNGQFVSGYSNVYMNESRITVNNIDRNQAGVYQCFAFNPFGAADYTFMVVVIPDTVTARTASNADMGNSVNDISEGFSNRPFKKGKPRGKKYTKKGKASNQSFTRPIVKKITSESAFVRWNIKDKNVLFFKVQFKDITIGSKSDWKTVDEYLSSSRTGVEVLGLEPDHEYRFRVAAVYENNDHKFSPSSKKFLLKKTVHITKPINSPILTGYFEDANNFITVKWTYQEVAETDGFILYYRKSDYKGGFEEIILLGNERRSYSLDMIEEKQMYDIQISSFNMAGRSPRSETLSYIPKDIKLDDDVIVNTSIPVIPIVTSKSSMFPNVYLAILMVILGVGLCVAVMLFICCYLRQKKSMRHLRKQNSCRCETKPNISANNNDPFLTKAHSTVNDVSIYERGDPARNAGNRVKVMNDPKEFPAEYDRFICKMKL